MNKRLGIVIFFWIFTLGISFSLGITSAKKHRDAMLLATARTFFDQVVLTRKWNSLHGGVYAKITETALPNAYLEDPERDIQTTLGHRLTKINPSYMTRQISELADAQDLARFHMTSLLPIRPQNQPTPWEKAALLAFDQQGLVETSQLHPGQMPGFIYMKALKAEASCLECHKSQGYKQGDILGGISVSLSQVPTINLFPILFMHLAVGSLGLFFILFYDRKLINAYETIHHQALFDTLTQIPNRRYFNQTMDTEFVRSQRSKTPLSVIMGDIDNFKQYNDAYGHNAGDVCLKEVAGGIRTSLTRPADFCARFGGEEFIILLPETDAPGALHIARKIQKNIHGLNIKHKASDVRSFVTLSMGVTTEEGFKTSASEIIKKADTALYKAKANGRDRVEVFLVS
ncbi:MAG: diguanylate cyclase [Desulfobacula sp.]|nr:diguanylate cyclase [Desulfobacula sp.]